jgi:hypothetical protein
MLSVNICLPNFATFYLVKCCSVGLINCGLFHPQDNFGCGQDFGAAAVEEEEAW